MKKPNQLRPLHLKNKLTDFEKKNILRIWSEGSVSYGNVLCFLISINGKKYVKKGFFYNYLLLKKEWVETMMMVGYWSSIEKYVLWVEDEPEPDQEVIDTYEQETGLDYPEVEPMVRVYFNSNTCEIKLRNGLKIPTSTLNSDNFRRPSTSKNLEELLEQYETEQRELEGIPDNQKKNWFDNNPWRVKCDPDLYVMEGHSKGKRYLQKALEKIGARTYEANLSQEERLMINHHDEYQYKQDLSILFWDIETDDRVKKQIVPGEFNILSISYADFNEFQEKGLEALHHIRMDDFDSEREMLKFFCDMLEKYDVCSGWNSDFFDLPYVKKRNAIKNVFFDWRYLYHIDLMKIYQEFYKSEKGDESMSFGLEAMGEVILGMKKIQHAEGIHEMYVNLPDKLRDYNNRDVEILCRLEAKNGFLRNYLAICSTSHVDYEHTGNYNKVKRDALVMAHKHKYFRYRDKTYDEKEADRARGKATGAFVAHPKPGLVSNVIAVDIGSLYPSTIMQFNICNSTFIDPEDYDKYEDHTTTANDARFRRDRIGYLPRMFGIIKQKRNYYKAIQKDLKDRGLINSNEFAVAESLEYAWKAKGLSIYGCLGLKSSILFNFDMVEAVTLSGQYFLTEGVRHLFGNAEHRRITDPGDVFCRRFQRDDGPEKERGPFSDLADFRYMDTDSVCSETQIQTTDQCLKIKNLFEKADSFRIDEQQGKEYAYFNDLVLPTYDQESGEIVDEKVEMIYRHKVPKKRRFRIKSSDGKYVDVTDCHSIMVLENGELVEKKPDQLKKGDKIISLNGVDQNGKK